VTIQPEPECERCNNPVGKIVQCDFADPLDDGDEDLRLVCEKCRPERHYIKCDDCPERDLIEYMQDHEDPTVLPPNIKIKRLCKSCKRLAVQKDERVLAGYTDPPRGDEHYFYDVLWRR